jgi:hypothetical protein
MGRAVIFSSRHFEAHNIFTETMKVTYCMCCGANYEHPHITIEHCRDKLRMYPHLSEAQVEAGCALIYDKAHWRQLICDNCLHRIMVSGEHTKRKPQYHTKTQILATPFREFTCYACSVVHINTKHSTIIYLFSIDVNLPICATCYQRKNRMAKKLREIISKLNPRAVNLEYHMPIMIPAPNRRNCLIPKCTAEIKFYDGELKTYCCAQHFHQQNPSYQATQSLDYLALAAEKTMDPFEMVDDPVAREIPLDFTQLLQQLDYAESTWKDDFLFN